MFFDVLMWSTLGFLVFRQLTDFNDPFAVKQLEIELSDTKKQLEKLKAIVAEVTNDFYGGNHE